MKKIRLMIAALLVMVSANVFAQNITVHGVVKDASTGESIPFAAVQVKGTLTGTSTDVNGVYKIAVPADATLLFTSVGYNVVEEAVASRTVIDVMMVPSTEFLNETIVVAYGTATKESFTGSASVVKSEDLVKRSVSNVSKAIEGLISGVTTTSGGGQPGEGSSVQIRGYGSINASSSPLYVVDGIPFDGNLASINPADIESMTVLKDASAGALYGARAANGVIMITTKQGKDGFTNINFKAQYGLQSRSLKRYDVVNQAEFVELNYESLYNSAIDAGYSHAGAQKYAANNMSNNLGGEFYNPYKNYTWATVIDPATGKVKADAVSAYNEDWMDELTNKWAARQEYQFGLNSGNERTKYALSFGYLDDQGILVTTNFRRYSGRVNVDHAITNWLKVGLNSSYANTSSNATQYSDTQTGNAWYTAQFMAPIYPVYLKNADGTDALDENGERQYDYGENGRPKGSNFNALGDLHDNKYLTTRDNVSYRSFIKLGGDSDKLGIFKGLALTVNFGGDLVNRTISSYYSPYHGDGKSNKGSISKTWTRTFSYTLNELLTYDRRFNDHSVNFLAGHEFYAYKYNYVTAGKTNVYPGIEELAPAVTLSSGNSYENNHSIESYLGRLNYSYLDKYFVSGSFRADGSSRFHKDHRWSKFWSVGASWRMSQEDFMKNVSWVDNATLKVSYGSQGNENLGSQYYAWQSFYDLTWPNAANAGAIVSTLENPTVSWEKNAMLNAGLNVSLFNRVLNVEAEYYRSLTSNMLLNKPMAMSTGFTGYTANVGSMQNTGIEATIKVNWLNKKNFTASSTLMVYQNSNKVIELTDESKTITSGVRVIKEGYPIYTYYMIKSAGVDPATGQQLYWAYETDNDGEMKPGTEYITSNVSEATSSKYYLGSRDPKIQGSFGSDFTFGQFDLSFLTTFSLGGKVYESVYSSSMTATYYGDTWNKNILRRWQKPGDITDVPKVEVGAMSVASDRWLIDASYFSIKSIQFGYTLPQRWTNKINMKSLRVFAVGDNICMFNYLNGMDPQYNFNGGANYSYAPTRTFSLGIDINF